MQFSTIRIDRAVVALLVSGLALGPAACRKDISSTADATSRLERLSRTSHVVAPVVSAEIVVAGSVLTVDCTNADAPPSQGQQVRAALFPDAPVVKVDGSTTTFAPTQVGSYVPQCVSDHDGSYAVGPTLQVLPGAPAKVSVMIEQHTVRAAEPLRARCLGEDAHGNALSLGQNSQEAGPAALFVVAGHEVAADASGEVPLDSHLEGAVEVRCRATAWPFVAASEAAVVQVIAAPTEALAAHVDGMFYGPHEPISVRCTGTDTFGNERPAQNALVQVLGGTATINGQSFFADKVGRYRVVCITPETTGNDGEAVAGLTSAVTEVNIAPGPPARWAVRWHATGACLSQTTPLPFTWRMYDAFDNALDFLDVELQTEPRTPLKRNPAGGYTISNQGQYTIKLTPVGPGTQLLPVWHKEVVVNSTPPEIVITSPKRAAMVQGTGNTVQLTGYVKSAYGPLASVSIGGVAQKEAKGRENYAFNVAVPSQWGLNIVHGEASDLCGNDSLLTQSYLYSSNFAPVATQDDAAARVPHAVRARFGQATWDDSDPNTLQDVATLMQMALESSSLEDRLPQFLGSYPRGSGSGGLPEGRAGITKPFKGKINGVEVFRNGALAFNKPTLEYLHTSDGGWDVAFNLEDLAVPFKVNQYAHWGIFGSGLAFTAPGTLTTSRMRVEAHIDVSMADGEPRATVDEHQVHVTFAEGAPDLNLSLPFDNYLGGRLEALVRRLFRDLPVSLVPIIEERVRKEMAAQMDIFLGGLQLHHSLPLPPPFETTLQVRSGLDHIELRGPEGAGYGDFGLYTQILSPEVPLQAPRNAPFRLDAPSYGPIRRAHIPRLPLALQGSQTFALAVHDDLLNQMLWALWAGGAFSRQFTANGLAPSDGATTAGSTGRTSPASSLLDAANLDVFFMSPPVVMPSENDNEIVLAIGDVWARAELMPKQTAGRSAEATPSLQAGFFFSTIIRAHVDIDADQGHLVLTPVGSPELFLQVNPVVPAVMTSSVQHWLSETLKSTLPRLMSETLRSFPLPQLAIGRIPGVPKDAVWVPDNGTLMRPAQGAEVMFQGTLRGALTAE